VTGPRAPRLFTRPLPLAAAVILVLNDHWWKRAFAGGWTGKLSDFAGVFFAPLLAAELSLLIRPSPDPLRRVLACAAAVGAVFAAVKTLPFASAAWVGALDVIGRPLSLRFGNVRDPTDLIALSMLPCAWLFARRALRGSPTT
jgi:hypothetical protein